MRKIIRDTSCDLLMIISITMSFIILFNIIPMIVQISDRKIQSGEYQNELNMFAYYDIMSNQEDSGTDEEMEMRREASIRKQVLALLNNAAEGNIYISGISLFLDDFTNVYADILIKQNEKLKWSYEQTGENNPTILVNTATAEHMKDNTLQISGQEFEVSGILKETSDKDSEKIVVYYENLDEEGQTFFKNKIQDSLFIESVMIRIMSDEDLQTTYQEISAGMAELGFDCSLIEDGVDLTSQSAMYQFLNKCAYAGAMILAVVNCVAVSGLWMQRQRREYIIRKAFGYDMNQIMLRIAAYMCRLGGIAAIAALLIQVIYLELLNGKNLFQSYSAEQAVYIILGMAGLIVLSSVRPYLQIRKINPAKGMADWQI